VTAGQDHRSANRYPLILLHGCYKASAGPRAIEEAAAALSGLNEHRSTKRRLLRIVIESIQNVMRHTATGARSEGFIVRIAAERDSFSVMTGNAIRKERAALLKDKIERINSAAMNELTHLYRRALQGGPSGDEGGAGLGLMDIARRSGKKLLYEFQEMSKEYCFFRLEVTVSRCNNSMPC
jgi:hypothetical protein